MNFLTDVFNNRELATFIWGLVLIVIFLINSKIRSSIAIVVKAFFQRNILLIFIFMILYTSLTILLLYNINLWDFTLIKETIYWILGVALVLLVNINEASNDPDYFKNLSLKNFRIMIVIELIVNLYTFSFIIEMIIIPIISFFVIFAVFSESKREYLPVKKLTNFIIGIFGIVVLIYSIINLISDFQSVWTFDNLKAFLLPILLLIMYMPFLYLLTIYMVYELMFIRLDIVLNKDRAINRYAKKKILALCNINLMRLNKFVKENTHRLSRFKSKEEIQEIVNDFKKGN